MYIVLCTMYYVLYDTYTFVLYIIVKEWEEQICKFTDISRFPTVDPPTPLYNNIPG